MDWLGIVAIAFFYCLIYAVGVIAGKKTNKRRKSIGGQTEEVMLAGRNIGTLVGIFTMTAMTNLSVTFRRDFAHQKSTTWVGGAYINGTAEALYKGGILGCQAPIGYALSLVLGGVLFAKPMRDQGYVTMLDPFQIKYGQRVGGLMFFPALLGEVFWTAAILSALGATLSVVLNWDMNISVIASAIIAVGYTYSGGLYAVAYTDVIQLFCIFVGLCICVPAALLQNKTTDIRKNPMLWLGEVGGFREKLAWTDAMLLLIFGGIPWQVYFQRVLSSRTSEGAQKLSFIAGIGCIIMAIPPALIGAIAKNTDWRLTEYDPWKNGTKSAVIPPEQTSMVVPLVFQYLTPKPVAFVGIGAVSAAVMSSADSSVLSSASMFAHNIWKLTIRPNASEREVIAVMKVGIIAVGVLATLMALTIQSIYGLWYLCADLVYVVLFPQLLCVIYFTNTNTYGCLLAYAVGLILRLSGGEPLLGFRAFVHYPWYDPVDEVQYFPFRTMSMLAALFCCIYGSRLAEILFRKGLLPPENDVLGCLVSTPMEHVPLPQAASFNASTATLNTMMLANGGSLAGGEPITPKSSSGNGAGAGLFQPIAASHPTNYLTIG